MTESTNTGGDFPSISIVVPNYNHARYLRRCLDAIVGQSMLPLELIIIDDCSTDNSAEIAGEYARRFPFIRLLQNPRNQGVVKNINHGMQIARGDFVLFPAADDELLPGFFEKSGRLLQKFPHAGLSCTIGDWVETATGLNWHVGVSMGDRPDFLSPERLFELERQGKVFVASNSTIYRRSALIDLGGFRQELRWQSDWFVMTVLGFRHGLCFVPEALARNYIYPQSFYGAGRKTTEHRRSLECLLDLLLTREYADVEPFIRKSGALFLFGGPILRLCLTNAKYRRFLNFAFLRKNLWYELKRSMKCFIPVSLGNLYFKISGQRASKPKVSAAG